MAIAASPAVASLRKRWRPSANATASFKTVFDSTPMAMAFAAMVTGTWLGALLAIEIIRAPTSVKPGTAPEINTPACPHMPPHELDGEKHRLKQRRHLQRRSKLQRVGRWRELSVVFRLSATPPKEPKR